MKAIAWIAIGGACTGLFGAAAEADEFRVSLYPDAGACCVGEEPPNDQEPPAPPTADGEWRAGLLFEIATAFGEPANDITGGSAFVSYRLDRRWWITGSLYTGAFDFENPGDQVLDTSNTPTADAKISMTALSGTAEWHFLNRESRFDPWIGAGAGIVFLGDGTAKALPTVDNKTDGGTGPELHLEVGSTYRLWEKWSLRLAARYTQYMADLDVEDELSADDGTMSSWNSVGFGLGLEYRW